MSIAILEALTGWRFVRFFRISDMHDGTHFCGRHAADDAWRYTAAMLSRHGQHRRFISCSSSAAVLRSKPRQSSLSDVSQAADIPCLSSLSGT